MKDCLRSHNEDEAREARIGFLTMRLHMSKSQEERRNVLQELEQIKAQRAQERVSE